MTNSLSCSREVNTIFFLVRGEPVPCSFSLSREIGFRKLGGQGDRGDARREGKTPCRRSDHPVARERC